MSYHPARPDAEYVLVYDHPRSARKREDVLVPQDTVVFVRECPSDSIALKVILGASSELEFVVKATGEKHTTNYGYMFALNTPENLERLNKARVARKAFFEAEKNMKATFSEVECVLGPFEKS